MLLTLIPMGLCIFVPISELKQKVDLKNKPIVHVLIGLY